MEQRKARPPPISTAEDALGSVGLKSSSTVFEDTDIDLKSPFGLTSLENQHFQSSLDTSGNSLYDTDDDYSLAQLEDFTKMSSLPVQEWNCLDCGFACAAMRSMQHHLEQQHHYEAAVSPENHPDVLIAVIASRVHDENCAWQTDNEYRPDGDCDCEWWECSISDVNLPQGRAVVEEYLKVYHDIDISEPTGRIWEVTTEEIVRKLAELVPYPTPASSPRDL